MEQARKVDIITSIVLVGFVVAVVFHYIMGMYQGVGFPYNTFLFDPTDRFNDLFNSFHIAGNFDPYVQKVGYDPAVYFPFAYTLLCSINFFQSQNFFPALIIILSLFAVFLIAGNYLALVNLNMSKANLYKNIFILSFLSYPFLFVVDRANIECILFIFLAGFLYFFLEKKYFKSALLLSLAVAMKGYPGLFWLLFIKERKFKELAVSVAFSAIITIGSLLLFRGTLQSNISGLLTGLNYIVHNSRVNYGSSLCGAIKSFLLINSFHFSSVALDNIFGLFSMVIFLLLSFYVIFKEKELWKQTAIIAIGMLLFMQVSSDYKLIILFIPFWLFLSTKNISKYDRFYSVLFGLMLIPKAYFFVVKSNNMAIELSAIINPLILLILMFAIMKERFMEKIKL
jgi:hypothetical protein